MQQSNQPKPQQRQQQKQKQKQKQKNNLSQITIIKRTKIGYYPYYPVTHTYSQNGYNYVFNLDIQYQYYTLAITPFREHKDKQQCVQLSTTHVELQCVPRRNVNFLYILEYDDVLNPNGKTVTVKLIDFVLGFSAGFLIRCKYTFNPKLQGNSNRQLSIVGKYNKKPDYKQGLMMRMTSTFFGSDQFYKVAVEKPVRNFQCYLDKKIKKQIHQKYNYSYHIGNRIYLSTQFSQQIQAQTLSVFNEIRWQQMPLDTFAKLYKLNSIVINSKRHKTLILSNSVLIQWCDQIASYIYTASNQLIVADNQQNRIIIFNVIDNMKIKSIYKFDLDIKKLKYFTVNRQKPEIFLLILAYDSNLFVMNLTQNKIVSLAGHKSYITQAYITPTNYIITGGCDHRVGLKNLKSIPQWNQLMKEKHQSETGTVYYQIESSKVVRRKMDQTYFLGEFNNVNSERNNNNDYGFGNFIPFQNGSQLYVFLTFDFLAKIYKIIL